MNRVQESVLHFKERNASLLSRDGSRGDLFHTSSFRCAWLKNVMRFFERCEGLGPHYCGFWREKFPRGRLLKLFGVMVLLSPNFAHSNLARGQLLLSPYF
jgi:hypothetical protein